MDRCFVQRWRIVGVLAGSAACDEAFSRPPELMQTDGGAQVGPDVDGSSGGAQDASTSPGSDAGGRDASQADASPPGELPCGGCSAEAPLCVGGSDAGGGACQKLEVLAFHSPGLADLAHVSFASGANQWFPSVADANGFTYEASSDWGSLRDLTYAPGRIVLFLDNAPYDGAAREAFQAFMEAGGGWMGFHVSAWTDDPSRWPWFYDEFLGSGAYWKNTWRPTSAVLKVESPSHPSLAGLGPTFTTAPNEWYAFRGDLVNNPAIEILLSIDPVSFPLGTNGNETWTSGYYPVVWTNRSYRMIYANMGHDDMDYGGTNQPLSSTFDSPAQNQFFLDAIRWLGSVTGAP